MNLLSLLEKLINEQGSASILRERLLLIKEEHAQVIEKCAQLEEKCAELVKEVSQLRQNLAQATTPSEFVEYAGVLFKRDATNHYPPICYCPKCKGPLYKVEFDSTVMCSNRSCGFVFNLHEKLQDIANKLNAPP